MNQATFVLPICQFHDQVSRNYNHDPQLVPQPAHYSKVQASYCLVSATVEKNLTASTLSGTKYQ